jgi:hypothetical protein
MNKYSIIILERQGGKPFVIPREYPTDNVAINRAMDFFRQKGLQKAVVVDASLTVVFKQVRKCKCTNVQQQLNDYGILEYRCIDCNALICHGEIAEEFAPELEEESEVPCV